MGDLYFRIILWFIAAGAVIFPIVYHRTARWWQRPAGRHLMGYSITVAMLAISGLIRQYLPDDPIQRGARFTLLTLAGLFVWHRLLVYLRAQREARPPAPERTDET